MILFAADSHYGQHCGRNLLDCIGDDYPIDFYENDWSCFEESFVDRYDLLMLNMIADTCDVPPPSDAAGPHIKAFLESGKPILLLHGSSAAFWMWDWWRTQVGFRWVRPNCPSEQEKSTHPKRPFNLVVSKVDHPLAKTLRPIELPTDEIYINLEQTRPTLTLMETTTDEGTFPQAYLTTTDWGGQLAAYIPGHAPEVVKHEDMVHNVGVLIDFLLKGG